MKARKNHLTQITLFLTSILITLNSACFALSITHQSIENLANSGAIQLSIQSTGEHAEECVEFTLKNNTRDSLFGFVEPGRRLTSNDPREQDILIVKEAIFALAPNETKKLNGYGFCCQSNNIGPKKGSGFGIGIMTNDNWQALAQNINKSNYPADAIQNAVWVLSDAHDIRSIPALAEGQTEVLRQFVATQLGITLPWYSFLYEEDSTRLYTGVANRLFADVSFNVPRRTMITGVVYDQQGNQIYDSPSYYVSGGSHHFQLNIPLNQFENGNYTFRLIEDFDIMNLERSFTL